MFRSFCIPTFALVSSVVPMFVAHAEKANKSNNPLNLAPGANLQGYYTLKLFDSNAHTNDLLLRGTRMFYARSDS
ncbi:hypothetical protein [Pseudomonas sp. 1 R 17]|uniref:hypothetical protein n=1 Tax=Pseudomonas sp. 1 R 17 TaxID=1844091 RepID=UPI000812A6E9|nr:hypothetical protein [Pseudomonas sp. 1 R 17]SAM30936.1 hypothetical protein BN1864_LIB5394:00983 [Pseudomonas sp. 1 R 17]